MFGNNNPVNIYKGSLIERWGFFLPFFVPLCPLSAISFSCYYQPSCLHWAKTDNYRSLRSAMMFYPDNNKKDVVSPDSYRTGLLPYCLNGSL